MTTAIMAGQRVVIPCRDFTHDLEAMATAITDKTRLIFISNPYNPTGTIVTAEQVGEFMEAIPDYVIVGFDEAYYEYVDDPDYPDCLKYVQEGRRAVVLRTFSKAYGLAGLRIGYGIAPPELATALKQVREPFNVSSIAQAAALASLQDPDQVQRSFQLVQDGKQYLYEQFEQMGLEYVPLDELCTPTTGSAGECILALCPRPRSQDLKVGTPPMPPGQITPVPSEKPTTANQRTPHSPATLDSPAGAA